MWSLPDIVRMNEEAASEAAQAKLQHEVESPHEHSCEVCEWNGKDTPADYSYLWFDIFSQDPKGTIFLCEQHDGYTGSPIEGYFTCAECERVFIENYTWELYSTVVGYDQLCLPCALKRYLEDDSHWIDARAVKQVILDPSAREPEDEWNDGGWSRVFDPDTGVLNLAACSHLIAVEMPVPDSLHFVGNLEFDSSTGQMLASYSSTYSPGFGEATALEKIQELAESGYTRFIAILDAAYQFSVSIGLYVDASAHRALEEGATEESASPGVIAVG